MKEKLTLHIDGELIKSAKHQAIDEGKSVSEWIADLIRNFFQVKNHD